MDNKHTFDDRLETISAQFLGKPYLLNALGEGEGAKIDSNPLYRWDAFDCLTFVETVLALAQSENENDFVSNLHQWRYKDGVVDYQNRLHFMSVDWNPNHVRRGVLKELTKEFINQKKETLYQVAEAIIDRPAWMRAQKNRDVTQKHYLEKLSKTVSAEKTQIAYLPLTWIFNSKGDIDPNFLLQLNNGSIIEMVRPDWDLRETIGTHCLVSHIGFIFSKKNAFIFRHSSKEKQQVVDENFEDYLRRYCDHDTVKGIAIFSPK